VPDEAVDVGRAQGIDRLRCQTGFGVSAYGVDAQRPGDLGEGGTEPLAKVQILERREFALVAGALVLGQQAGSDGLVGDEDAEPAGVTCGDMQADDGAETAAEHEDGTVRERGQEAVHVVGVVGHRDGSPGAVETAARESATVVGDHRAGAGEPGDQVDGAVRFAFPALRDQQQRSAAADLVVQHRAGNGECAGGGTESNCSCWDAPW
jgi:hypothetical protein